MQSNLSSCKSDDNVKIRQRVSAWRNFVSIVALAGAFTLSSYSVARTQPRSADAVTVDEKTALPNTMLDAIEQNDMAKLAASFADDGMVWRNFDPVPRSIQFLIPGLLSMPKFIQDFKYEERTFLPTGAGMVVKTVFRAKTLAGAKVEMPMIFLYTFRGGKIAKVEEYLDTAQMPPNDAMKLIN